MQSAWSQQTEYDDVGAGALTRPAERSSAGVDKQSLAGWNWQAEVLQDEVWRAEV
jgi:hypothetical protein